MKNFLYTFCAFALTTLLLACAMDYAITKGLHRYTTYKTEVFNDLRSPDFDHDVLILGSSQAVHDFHPGVIDSILGCDCYVLGMPNLTMPAHRFAWDLYRYYHPDKLPKMVILTLDYADLCTRDVKTSLMAEYMLPLFYNPVARDFLKTNGSYNFGDLYVPCYRYYGFQHSIKYGLRGFTKIGYQGEKEHVKGFAQEPWGYEWDYQEYIEAIIPYDSTVVTDLDDFLQEMNQLDVSVVVIVAPLTNVFSNVILNLSEIYSIYERLAYKHNCQFYNLEKITPLNQEYKDYFTSDTHLSEKGATIFSDSVANKILQND